MKILSISGTPHEKNGASTTLLNHVFDSIRKIDHTAECENIFLTSKNIGYCTGCAVCLSSGTCPQKDDMNEIVCKMFESDGIIFSSPVYAFHVTAQMKTFIDRLIPYGHRHGFAGIYSLAISVSSGWGDKAVAEYMAGMLSSLGTVSVGTLCAAAAGNGVFRDMDSAIKQAEIKGRQLAAAINRKLRPAQKTASNSYTMFRMDTVQEYPSLFREGYRNSRKKICVKKQKTFLVKKNKNILAL